MKSLFTFRGRAGRKAFVLFTVIAALAAVPVRIALDLAIHSLDSSFTLKHVPHELRFLTLPVGIATAAIIVGIALVLCLAVATVSFLVRRFHDMGLSGWFVLPAFVLSALVPDIDMPSGLLPPLGTLVWTILMALVPGTPGPNRHGSPRGAFDAEASGSPSTI